MADTAILDSLIPAQPIVSARPSATSTLDSLLAASGATPVQAAPPSNGALPDWALYDSPEQKRQNERRGSPQLTQGPRPQTWGNIGSAIPSGLYEGLAKAANLPTHAVNAVSGIMGGLTGQDYGKLGTPIQENPTGYQPAGHLAESLHSGASAISNTAALGAAAKVVAPMLPAASAPRLTAEAIGRTPPSVIAASGVGGAVEEPAARQAPEPLKPLVRVGANVAAGGLTAGLETAAGNAVRSNIGPQTARLAELARDTYDIPIRAGQISGNRIVRTTDSALKSIPLSGHGAVDDHALDAWIRAVSNTMGENSTRITPEVMNAARTRIGGVMDDIGARTNLQLDQHALDRLTDIHDRAGLAESGLDPTQIAQVRAHIDKILEVAAQNNGVIPGPVYQNMTRQGESLNLLQDRKSTVAGALGTDIRRTLDGMLDRSVAPEDAAALREARAQWKAMRTIEPLTLRADIPGQASPATGAISPQQLRHVVNQSYGRAAFAEPGDLPLNDLAHIGQRFLKEPPSSHTSERSLVQRLIHGVGPVGAALFGAEHGLGISPMEVAIPAAAGAAATVGVSRGISSALRSDRLANRMIRRGMEGEQPAVGAVGGAGQASVPLLTSSGIRQLEPPPAVPAPSLNPVTGLPQFNLKDGQRANREAMAKDIGARIAGGTLANDADLKAWINEHKRDLRAAFGGQGIQNILLVSSLMRRANGDKTQPASLFSAVMGVGSYLPPDVTDALRGVGITDKASLAEKAILSPELLKTLAAKTARGDLTKGGTARLLRAIAALKEGVADVGGRRGFVSDGPPMGRRLPVGQDSHQTSPEIAAASFGASSRPRQVGA